MLDLASHELKMSMHFLLPPSIIKLSDALNYPLLLSLLEGLVPGSSGMTVSILKLQMLFTCLKNHLALF